MILGHLRQNVVAYLALVVALSTGSAYAAGQIANGSVTTKKIATNAVTSTKIRNGSVKGIDIRGSAVSGFTILDGSVTSSDLDVGAVGSVDILDGSVASPDLRDGSVASVDIKDDTIVRQDINDGVVPQDADIFVSGTGANPSQPTPQGDPNTFTFDLTRNAKLAIEFFAGKLGVPCSGGQPAVGLYIDGSPQAGTLTTVPAPAEAGAVQIVTNQFLTAGTHTLSTREQCAAGAYGVNVPDERVTWTVHVLAR